MKWAVYRETSTEEVWACMESSVQAETGEDAIKAVAPLFASHLMGWYFAVPADAQVFRRCNEKTETTSWVEVHDMGLPRSRREKAEAKK